MKGILDTQAVSMYMDDFKKSFEVVIKAELPEINIYLLEKRYEVLKDQEEDLVQKIEDKKKEIERVLAGLGGELLTLKQMLIYVCKEEGACEMKLQELKKEQENGSIKKAVISR